MDIYSTETLFGNITLKQSKCGYRYSVDPILVSYFAKPAEGDIVVDLGTGCGIIPIILAHRTPSLSITGVEIQDSLARLARENVSVNNMSDIIHIRHSDMKKSKDFIESSSVDMVITNPPYTKKNSGRVNPDQEKAIARHEIKITLEELVKTASDMLKEKGHFVVVYPRKRLADMIAALEANCINPKLLRFVHTKKNMPPVLFLLKGEKNGTGELKVDSPVYVYDGAKPCVDDLSGLF